VQPRHEKFFSSSARPEREIAGDAGVDGDYVFTTGLGRPVPPDTVTDLMAVLIRQFNKPAIPGTRKTPRQELPGR
jgi:integrase